MAHSTVSQVRISGLACAVPETVVTLADEAEVFGEQEIARISQNIGVRQRHVAKKLCASDLCHAAAERLLGELNWERDSIDLLVFVSQTGDYLLPATACVLQDRLGLPKSCAALDLSQGCSGYVYGLWVASQLMTTGGVRRVLLLTGDTTSRIVSPQDRSLATLFGDAGAATALEWDESAGTMYFELGSDGSGKDHLIVPAGGFRTPSTPATAERTERESGIIRSDEDLAMDGAELFTFTLREVPGLLERIHHLSGWNTETVDSYVFHQANLFMLNYLGKRLKLPPEKIPVGMRDFGNTSCASIPLAMVTELADRLISESLKLVLVGFGVGLSWGAVAMECGSLTIPPLVVLLEPS